MTVTTLSDILDNAEDAMATGKYSAAFVIVTPGLAQSWLDTGSANRNINSSTVAKYQRDIENDGWAFTGEAVKFSNDGKLLDGQHRLTAVTRSGQPILMLVVRGLDKAAQDVMDTGRKRSAADMLRIHGQAHAVLTASVARLICGYRNGHIKSIETQYIPDVTHAEVKALVATDPFLPWVVNHAATWREGIPATPAAIGFAAWLCGRVDESAALEFFSSLSELRTDGPGDPRLALLKRLRAMKDGQERTTSVVQAGLMVRSWNTWRTGRTVTHMKRSHTTDVAFPEPV